MFGTVSHIRVGGSGKKSRIAGATLPVDVSESYRTLAGRGRAAFTVRGSAFVGHAAPARDVEAAETFVDAIREEYDDATHNVPAYRVRADPFREYASDDGEPAGSAGDPVLNVLQGEDLENVVVVVTRYYGGTDLRDRVRSATSGRAEIE